MTMVWPIFLLISRPINNKFIGLISVYAIKNLMNDAFVLLKNGYVPAFKQRNERFHWENTSWSVFFINCHVQIWRKLAFPTLNPARMMTSSTNVNVGKCWFRNRTLHGLIFMFVLNHNALKKEPKLISSFNANVCWNTLLATQPLLISVWNASAWIWIHSRSSEFYTLENTPTCRKYPQSTRRSTWIWYRKWLKNRTLWNFPPKRSKVNFLMEKFKSVKLSTKLPNFTYLLLLLYIIIINMDLNMGVIPLNVQVNN